MNSLRVKASVEEKERKYKQFKKKNCVAKLDG